MTSPSVPPGQRVYAVGDIHGRADLLEMMLALVRGDLVKRPCQDAALVLVGDYVDRGPDSRKVLDILSAYQFPGKMIPLRGNHDEFVLQFLATPEAVIQYWLALGGSETLYSYGINVRELRRRKAFAELAENFSQEFPEQHKRFLENLPLSVTIGDYFFCHAGVRPGTPLACQQKDDLLGIRQEFLGSSTDFGKVVVHGHTPVREPEIRHNRINLDTGAYITNRLTCLILEGSEQRFLSTK